MADHQSGVAAERPAHGVEHRLGWGIRGQGFHGAELAPQRLRGLLRAQRRAHQDARAFRQALVEPLRHALGLALALGCESAPKVRFTGPGLHGLGMAPEDQVHVGRGEGDASSMVKLPDQRKRMAWCHELP